RYERADLNHLALAAESVDLAYSALALHYLENLQGLIGQVHQALRPGGHFIFSVEHPVYSAPTRPGWSVYVDGHKTWPVDNYSVEGPRVTNWLTDGVVKHHRTIGTYLNMLIHAGFIITEVEEWRPSTAQIAAQPELAEELLRPMFLLVSARR